MLKIFIDSSVIIAALLSAEGGSAKLLAFCESKVAEGWISDCNDAPILAAAKFVKVDVLLTLDIRHFIKDPMVAKKSKLRIMTPAEFWQGFMKVG